MPTTQLNGTELFFDDSGHGEPLLLVHGSWVDHTSWNAVVPELAQTFRVVTVDLRGHGKSRLEPPDGGTVHDDVADVVALIDHLDLAPVNVAGISSGACIALRLASAHPRLVRRVLPHEPPFVHLLAADPENAETLEEFGALIAAVQQHIEAGDHRAAAELFFDSLVEPWSTFTPAEKDMITAHAVAFAGQLHDPDAIAIEPQALTTIVSPVLLSEGEHSRVPFGRIVEQLGAVIPNNKRHVVSGSGHIPQQTHPDQYAEMVVDFMRAT